MEPKTAKVAILTADFFEESELIFPYYRLLGQVQRVVVATPDRRPAKGKGGLSQFAAQASFSELSADDFDAVIVPGGFAPDIVRRSNDALAFLTRMDQVGKPVGMICHGAWVALTAGLLGGRTLTSAPSIRPEVEGAGATWIDQPVVVDGNMVTSRLPQDLDTWMEAFLDVLSAGASQLATAGARSEGLAL
ncbi:type 1 glutamine amidotransferase domain-containing protein [Paenarthrobacter sp. PH39-S1]|uniref:type 1 glutamine amidotransferase domain-containing protein n=1 Tax=Paenarthrobacter sp. PH39-S1 TaxID=3046204 RepID=UPI0024B97C38|nr:type 1 glutamine amidotransferase domain-containing protein [Paenarthrobacter sp. PH39-S1]MDJ0357322.1 type 1 glutamine amidotransferase domain-containing protein [Paenarthrobacter sp. PH39-S1]